MYKQTERVEMQLKVINQIAVLLPQKGSIGGCMAWHDTRQKGRRDTNGACEPEGDPG